MKELQLRNRQRDRTINTALLRRIVAGFLEDILGSSQYEIAIHLVSERRISELNEAFLRHKGRTDVITFDLRSGYEPGGAQGEVAGEIYVCVSVAEQQAREFTTRWE